MNQKDIEHYLKKADGMRWPHCVKIAEILARMDMYIAITEFFKGLTIEQKADAVARANKMLDEFEAKYGDK